MTYYIVGMIAIVVIVLIISLVLISKAYSYKHDVDLYPSLNDDQNEDNQ